MSEETISLHPVAEADLPKFVALVGDPERTGPFQWFGYRDPGRRFGNRWAENGLLSEEQSVLVVRADDEFAGFVSWRQMHGMTNAPYWNIGVQLCPEMTGRGIGTTAQRMLVDYLFAHTTAMRIEADTEATNYAEQRALEKAGFTREGLRRGIVFRDGEWRDSYCYGLLRTDPRP